MPGEVSPARQDGLRWNARSCCRTARGRDPRSTPDRATGDRPRWLGRAHRCGPRGSSGGRFGPWTMPPPGISKPTSEPPGTGAPSGWPRTWPGVRLSPQSAMGTGRRPRSICAASAPARPAQGPEDVGAFGDADPVSRRRGAGPARWTWRPCVLALAYLPAPDPAASIASGGRIRIARKSLTLVSVGPVTTWAPARAK